MIKLIEALKQENDPEMINLILQDKDQSEAHIGTFLDQMDEAQQSTFDAGYVTGYMDGYNRMLDKAKEIIRDSH